MTESSNNRKMTYEKPQLEIIEIGHANAILI